MLHARIPRQLDEELRDRAGQLGLSVSTIVRNVLLNTFDLVEDIVTDGSQILRNLRPSAPAGPGGAGSPAANEPPAHVVAWQEGLLNVNGVCDSCNALLPRGTRAAIGIPVRDRPQFLCLPCQEELAAPASGDPSGADVESARARLPLRTP